MLNEFKKSYYNTAQTLTLATRCVALMPEALIQSLNLGEALQNVHNAISALENSLTRTLKSDFTKPLAELDDICDEALRFLNANTKSYAHSHNSAKREAGAILHNALRQMIPSIENMGYTTEMAKILALHTEYQQPKYQQAIQLLHLEDDVQHLIDSRNAFEAMHRQKNDAEKPMSDSPSTKSAATATLQALETLLRKLAAHKEVSETEELIALEVAVRSVLISVNKASK